MIAEIIEPHNVDRLWPQLAEGFVKSCTNTNQTAGNLWQLCRGGNAFLVVAHEDDKIHGACVVRFEPYGDRQCIRGLGLSGSKGIEHWIGTLRDKVNEMGREGGATVFVDEGRPGFAKLIKDARIVRVTFEVDIQ